MATIKIVRRKNKQKKDGTAPLALRISKDYKTNYIFLGQYVHAKDWDADRERVKNSHYNSKRVNHYLLTKLTETQNIIFDANEKASTKEIKRKAKGFRNQKSFFQVAAERIKSKYDTNTFSVARAELSMLYNLDEFLKLDRSKDKAIVVQEIMERRRKRVSNRRKTEYTFLDAIKDFRRNKNLYFEDIDNSFLTKYKTFCVSYLGQSTRTITNQLVFIRTLFNIAIKDGVVDAKYYPFAGDKERIRIGTSHKIGLTREEVEKIEAMELEPDTNIWHTLNVWLVAFYFAGIRISDVVKLRWSDFRDGRLLYVMNKNEKPLSLKVPDKAAEILEKYKKNQKENQGYVFPFLSQADPKNAKEVYIKTKNATKLFNKYLKRIAQQCGIEKNLSTHIARHTFGNIAGDKIHPLMLQKLYRHSDLKTTLNYQANFIHREADEALDSVVNF